MWALDSVGKIGNRPCLENNLLQDNDSALIRTPDYLRVISGGRDGHHGCELWIHCGLKIGEVNIVSPSPSMEDTAQTCSLTLGFSQHRSDWRGRHSFSLWYMLRVKAQRRTAVMNGGNSADIFPTDFARWVLSSFWGTSMPDLVEGWQAELAHLRPRMVKSAWISSNKWMDGYLLHSKNATRAQVGHGRIHVATSQGWTTSLWRTTT